MRTIITSVAIALFLVSQSSLRAEKDVKAANDTDFLIKATRGGVAEVRVSEYAAKHASNEKVREYAERLVKEHQALNNVIAKNATRLKVAVVAGLEPETREKLDKLSKLKGNDLDREYLKRMIADHEKAIKLFESESKSSTDEDLKTVAKNNLPTLRDHLKEARNLASAIKD